MGSGKVAVDASVTLRIERRDELPPVAVRAIALRPERMPLYRGYPLKPQAWVNTAGYSSLKGVTVTGRPAPAEITIDSALRYLPADETQTFYTKLNEAITRSFVIGPQELGPQRGSNATMTVSAVMHVLEQGTILESPTLNWDANDKLDALYGDNGEGIPTVTTRHPLIVTSVMVGSMCTTYVDGKSSTIRAKTDVLPTLGFTVGNDATRLFEFNLWLRALTPEEVAAHHAKMTMIYGEGVA